MTKVAMPHREQVTTPNLAYTINTARNATHRGVSAAAVTRENTEENGRKKTKTTDMEAMHFLI